MLDEELADPSRVQSYNQFQKYLRHCTVFWHKWPVHDLVLVIPPPPLIKIANNTRPYSKLGGKTLNGRRREVSIISYRPVTRSDLKCLNNFATGCTTNHVSLHLWIDRWVPAKLVGRLTAKLVDRLTA